LSGPTPVCVVDSTGIHIPDFATVLLYYTTGYQGIYGSDTLLASDDQDGELLGLLAQSVYDCNQMAVSVYNSYSPATAQGAGLSSVVKINGIARDIPSNSTVDVSIGGVVTLTITNGLVSDPSGIQWALPASVTIPSPGAITVTATCLTAGAIQLVSGSVMTPINPTLGWQTAVTVANATPGAPAELDPALRIRQSLSTALPSSTMLDGIQAAVLAVPDVVTTAFRIYENDTPAPAVVDTLRNTIPGNSIAVVTQGGDAMAIAQAIAGSKFAAGTYGTTTETIIDSLGISHAINFFFLTQPPIAWVVTLTPGPQFSTNTIALIQNSMAAFTNLVGTGNNLQISRAYNAAYLGPSISNTVAAFQAAVASGDTTTQATLAAQLTMLNQAANTYEITALAVGRNGATPTPTDVAIAFNESAFVAVNPDGSLVNPTSVLVNI
jgi:Baseplate J-like protein